MHSKIIHYNNSAVRHTVKQFVYNALYFISLMLDIMIHVCIVRKYLSSNVDKCKLPASLRSCDIYFPSPSFRHDATIPP